MAEHNYFANLIWQIADLHRCPYRPPQYERVMLPMTVLRWFDCVLAPPKANVLTEYERRKGGKVERAALDARLNRAVEYFKGAHDLNPELESRYAVNRPGLTRQLNFSPRSKKWLGSQCAKRHDKSGDVDHVASEASTLDASHEEETNYGLARSHHRGSRNLPR